MHLLTKLNPSIMTSQYLEEETLDLTEIDIDAGDDADPRFVEVCRVGTYAELTLDTLLKQAREGALVEPEYATAMWEAYKTVIQVRAHADREAIRVDFDRLPDDLRAEVRAHVEYAAPHFGVDLDLAPPDDVAADHGGERR